jgi:hypothetical protein
VLAGAISCIFRTGFFSSTFSILIQTLTDSIFVIDMMLSDLQSSVEGRADALDPSPSREATFKEHQLHHDIASCDNYMKQVLCDLLNHLLVNRTNPKFCFAILSESTFCALLWLRFWLVLIFLYHSG